MLTVELGVAHGVNDAAHERQRVEPPPQVDQDRAVRKSRRVVDLDGVVREPAGGPVDELGEGLEAAQGAERRGGAQSASR